MRYTSFVILSLSCITLGGSGISLRTPSISQTTTIQTPSLHQQNNSARYYDTRDPYPYYMNHYHTVPVIDANKVDDKDNDGVRNRDDQCPNTPENALVDLKGCELDSDGDGVMDSQDKCPFTPEDEEVDSKGCAKKEPLNIHFKAKDFKISDDTQREVEDFAAFLRLNKEYHAIIYGYTDAKEVDSKSAKALSQKRADTVMNAIISHGVDAKRLNAIGMGSKNPIASNESSLDRAKNRRIEVELLH